MKQFEYSIKDLLCTIVVGCCLPTMAFTSIVPPAPPPPPPAENQTSKISRIFPGSELPFKVSIEEADFSLPLGIHSYAFGKHDGKWVFLAGRTNGMHSFEESVPNNNFPADKQNDVVYVVDPIAKTTISRQLTTGSTGLTQDQIDSLKTTSPQSYYTPTTIYMTGGYGEITDSGPPLLFSTKDKLSAINIEGLVNWVENVGIVDLTSVVRQISDPIFQVTGGYMTQFRDGPTLLVFGQNFQGYYTAESNGLYTYQVRRFNIIDDGVNLSFEPLEPSYQHPAFRRRDLNVVRTAYMKHGKIKPRLEAFSGVFTESGGIWTVPVRITTDGMPSMPEPEMFPKILKQGMNNYVSATVGLFSKHKHDMYNVLLGGISYGYYQNGKFKVDSEIPFINQVTTIKINKHGLYKQYIMGAEYPEILDPITHNPLLFGAGADFIFADGISTYFNEVINFDALKGKTLVGYVVGGIKSKVPNTSDPTDSNASAYIFKVYITPQ